MRAFLASSTLALALALVACGSDDSAPAPGDPYSSQAGTTVVVGKSSGPTVHTTPSGDGCIETADGCVRPQDKCGENARADVIVDESGKVIDVVCYPASSSPTPVDENGNVELGKKNKGVVAIDGADDGVDVQGDVTSKGNNVTVYGQGDAVSIIGGSVTAEGNNFAMRGVRVKETVTIEGNNGVLVLSTVDGDVVVKGNNTVIASTTILGKLTVVGNNTKLVGNMIAGGVSIDGQNSVCEDNVAFTDSDGDGHADGDERGEAIACPP